MIVWTLGEQFDTAQLARASADLPMFSDSRVVARRLGEQGRRTVTYLPPAVQPRIDNPIGHWNQEVVAEDGASHAGGRPHAWAMLASMVRGHVPATFVRTMSDDEPGLDQTLDLAPVNRPSVGDQEMVDSWSRAAVARAILRDHTLHSRLLRVGQQLFRPAVESAGNLVSVLLCTRRPQNLEFALENVTRQCYRPLELVLLLHGEGFVPRAVEEACGRLSIPTVVLTAPAECTLGECLQQATDAATGAMLAKFDDDDIYSPSHIQHLAGLLVYTGAGIAARRTALTYDTETGSLRQMWPGAEYARVYHMLGGTMLARREVFCQVRWRHKKKGEDGALSEDCFRLGLPVVTGDRFGGIVVRGDREKHTWKGRKRRRRAGLDVSLEQACSLLL